MSEKTDPYNAPCTIILRYEGLVNGGNMKVPGRGNRKNEESYYGKESEELNYM